MEGQSLSWYNIRLPSLVTSIQILMVALVASRDRRLKETDGIRKSIFLLSAVQRACDMHLAVRLVDAHRRFADTGFAGKVFSAAAAGRFTGGHAERDGARAKKRTTRERTLMGLAMTDIWAVTFVFLSAVA